MSNNWMNYLSQPFTNAAKKIIFQLIGDNWTKHERIMDIMFRSITSEKDYGEFGSLITEIYEAGYMRAIDEHEKELNRLGFKVTLKKTSNTPEVKSTPLF